MSQHLFTTTLIKKNDKLQHEKETYLELYNKFINDIPEGKKVEVIFQVQESSHTNAQLAKVHANIRELANETGHTFEEIKIFVKKRSGLCTTQKEKDGSTILCKSFSECSKEELNLAIQASIELGETLGINLY